ncbi:MAG: Gfo/Idh/MocA family oxidoreductase [Victivallales bacterium]|jgi:predicted dehydrogenase|nr:Gfo/Idh/MocA family oxidoreductase [Victivallales bacterium]
MKKLKVGILGGGYMAQIAHIPALKSLETTEIAAICDARTEVAAKVAAQGGIPQVCHTVPELLQTDIDAVFILTPVQCHAANIKAALSAGKAIFCEKPAAMAVSTVRELMAEQAKYCQSVGIGYMKRHDVNINYFKELQRSEKWGKLTFIRAHSFVGKHWNANVNALNSTLKGSASAVFDATELDSGPTWLKAERNAHFYSFDNPYYGLLDTGCHTVNLLRYLAESTPEVAAVRNQSGVRLIDFDFGDWSGTMEFCVNFRMWRWDEVTELYFENASVRIMTPPPLDRQSAAVVEIYSEKGASKEYLTIQDNHQWEFRVQAENFVTRILNGEKFSDLGEAEKDLEIIEQIYRKETRQ